MAQRLKGIVVSGTIAKTVVVKVSRLKKHPRYGKFIKISQKYKAHTETPITKGSIVVMESTRPISRHKRWKIIDVQEIKL